MIKRREDFLPLARPSLGEVECREICQVLMSGWLTTGPKVNQFEQAVRDYVGCRAAAGLCSCTGGLHAALEVLGVGPGDEVIVPSLTFAASAMVVHWLGAKPVLADMNPDDLCLDPANIEAVLTSRTKGVIPVHFGGYPCDMLGINELAARKGLFVLEDAAHMMGANYRHGPKVGDTDNIAVFSFYATKNMTTAEGGMAVSNNEAVIESLRRKSYFGISKAGLERYTEKGSWYYEIQENGFKYNMDSLQAALGLAQLTRLDEFNQRRRHLARLYREGLGDVPAVRLPGTPVEDGIWHLFIIQLRPEASRVSRDELFTRLKKMNIGAGVHYIPLHLHPFFQRTFGHGPGDFPQAERYYNGALSLPLFPGMSDDDVAYVCEVIRQAV